MVFCAGTFATFAVIYLASKMYPPESLSAENGPLELLQVGFVGAASLMLFFAAMVSDRGRAGLTVMASLAGYATAKEMDSVFEALLFDDAYKYVAAIPLMVVATVVLWRERQNVIRDAAWLMNQRTTTMFVIAGLYLFCVCQVIDGPVFWRHDATLADSVWSGSSETQAVKQMVEEYCEVFAYAVLGFAGAEAVVMAFVNRQEESAAIDEHFQPVTISIASYRESLRRAA